VNVRVGVSVKISVLQGLSNIFQILKRHRLVIVMHRRMVVLAIQFAILILLQTPPQGWTIQLFYIRQ